MRKISKSRADDDIVSSTNGSGSLGNEDQDADQSVEQNENKSEEKDKNDSTNDNYTDELKETTTKTKSLSRKRKSGKSDKTNDDSLISNSNLKGDDDTADDYESDESKEVTKKTPKSKAKGKSKKRKSARDSKKKVEEEEYEVERIVDSKRIRGKLHYLIRWKGYSAASDSWEPHDTLSCPDVINKFNEEKENPPKKSNKRKGKKKDTKVPAKKTKTQWDSENADENAEYEVERILEVHHKKNGEREFLIHWKGWSSKFDSWEPEKNLNCSELIKRFMDKVSVARTTTERNLRVAPGTTNRFTLQDPTSGRRLSKRRGQRQRVRYDNAE